MAEETFTSLGGSDIHAVFGNYKFASIQMIRYAVSREKAQIYTLGSPSARATARGKRSVSGAFVFTLIDKKGLVKAMAEAGGTKDGEVFLSHDEIANFANSANVAKPKPSDMYKNATSAGGTVGITGVVGVGNGNSAASFNPYTDESIFQENNFGTRAAPYLADQLLPFDITIVGIPEYGSAYAKRLIIHGVEIMTEASGTSIDDLVIEKQNSFIARSVSDWVALTDIGGATGSGTVNNNRFARW